MKEKEVVAASSRALRLGGVCRSPAVSLGLARDRALVGLRKCGQAAGEQGRGAAMVFVMNKDGYFHRQHLLAEARRHLALVLRGDAESEIGHRAR
ncbi:hypothetical protein [Streptomyces sp. NPDC040750]|uniref:hypothetical protein n=1 Tax=Streptomyces sp. NPDC040750 TaxID=3154491 RepID=UPI0033E04F62